MSLVTSLAPPPTQVAPLNAEHAADLARDGCLLLRGAVPAAWCEDLRAARRALRDVRMDTGEVFVAGEAV